jgi:hypothetical protein
VNKKQYLVDSSDQESLEMVSIYGGDLFESQQEERPKVREGLGGMIGLSASRPQLPFPSMIDRSLRSTTPPNVDLMGSFIVMEKTSSRYSEIESIDDIASPFIPAQRSDLQESLLVLPPSIMEPFKETFAEEEQVVDESGDKEDIPEKDLLLDGSSDQPHVTPPTQAHEKDTIPDPSPEDIIRVYLEQYERIFDTFIDVELMLPFLRSKLRFFVADSRSQRMFKLVSCLLLAGLGSYVLFRARSCKVDVVYRYFDQRIEFKGLSHTL